MATEESQAVNLYCIEPVTGVLPPNYSGTSLLRTLWDLILVLITEVSSIQRSFNTLQYYTGTQNGVLIIEVSAIQRFFNREVPLYNLYK